MSTRLAAERLVDIEQVGVDVQVGREAPGGGQRRRIERQGPLGRVVRLGVHVGIGDGCRRQGVRLRLCSARGQADDVLARLQPDVVEGRDARGRGTGRADDHAARVGELEAQRRADGGLGLDALRDGGVRGAHRPAIAVFAGRRSPLSSNAPETAVAVVGSSLGSTSPVGGSSPVRTMLTS